MYADHKLMTFIFNARQDKHFPREIRPIDYISQFTTGMRFIKGEYNSVADALSRSYMVLFSMTNQHVSVNMADFARAQSLDEELRHLHTSTSLTFAEVSISGNEQALICDISTETA